jgi:predicted  nucleic acid-binding Zn-ribbon protein
MKTNNQKILIIGVAVVAAIAIFFAGLYISKYKSAQNRLTDHILTYDQLLSEKLEQEKLFSKLKSDFSLLQKDKEIAESSLNEAEQKIKELENQLKSIDNKGKKVKSLENQISDLQKKIQSMERELAENKSKNDQLADKNAELNMNIADLEEQISALNQKVISSMFANNYRIESHKGKSDKLTINAKKTKKILMSFDIPQDIATNINLKITTPEGQTISGGEKNISWKVVDVNEIYLASKIPYLGEIEVKKRIEITYKPERKLNKGIYTLEFYDKNNIIGVCQIRFK